MAEHPPFSTEEASGNAQAANIIEGLEAGARVLLMDEDTSATNFMIRDRRMQLLVARIKNRSPFVDRVRQLYRERGVSTILVIGGSGDYFDVADTVIVMESCTPREATAAARRDRQPLPHGRRSEAGGALEVRRRAPARKHRPVQAGGSKLAPGMKKTCSSAARKSTALPGADRGSEPGRAIGDLIFYALKEKNY